MNLHILKSIYICDQNELFRILADGNQFDGSQGTQVLGTWSQHHLVNDCLFA